MAIQFPTGVPLDYIHAASNGINYQWDGVKWTTQTDGSNSSIGSNPGPNPPANPVNGDFWFDTDDGQLYVYEVNQWVKSSTPNAGYNMADLPDATLL